MQYDRCCAWGYWISGDVGREKELLDPGEPQMQSLGAVETLKRLENGNSVCCCRNLVWIPTSLPPWLSD